LVGAFLLSMGKRHPRLLSYFDVLEACAEPGCPLCRLSERKVNRYLDGIMYEYVNDPGTRGQLRRSLGYCNEHAWRLPETGGGPALGIAIIYRDLAGQALSRLENPRYAAPRRFSLRRLVEVLDRDRPTAATESVLRRLEEQCPACAHRDTMEDIALIAVLEALARGDERMQTALNASSGLCLPHLRRALELVRDEVAFECLAKIAQEKLAALNDELGELLRKSDYRFNKGDFGPERDSWRRAIAWVAGSRGVR